MSYLGYANPFYHLGCIMRGYLAAPPPYRSMPSDFYIIGHRGAPLVAPENTIAAFAKAVEFGANAIETDVCVTQDDCFILWHDADPNNTWALARQWGGEGLLYVPDVPALGSPWRRPVRELALAALRTSCRYIRRKPVPGNNEDGEAATQVVPAVFEDFIAWLWHERRVKHVFLDLKELVALGVNGIITDNPALLSCIVMDYGHKRSGLASLRGCLKSLGCCEPTQLIVFAQAARLVEPRQGAFDHPPTRQQHKAFGPVRTQRDT
jgi:hypothetical protein